MARALFRPLDLHTNRSIRREFPQGIEFRYTSPAPSRVIARLREAIPKGIVGRFGAGTVAGAVAEVGDEQEHEHGFRRDT
jgi:hypothetical protein